MRYRNMKYAVKLLESEWDLGKKRMAYQDDYI